MSHKVVVEDGTDLDKETYSRDEVKKLMNQSYHIGYDYGYQTGNNDGYSEGLEEANL